MYCVGLTGTIASGKSTVAALFAKLGAGLISADHIARQLTAPGQPAHAKIVAHFGDSMVDTSGQLHRALLREYIFQHPAERIWMEQLLHPLIREEIEKQIQQRPCFSTSPGLSAGSKDSTKFMDPADKPRDVGYSIIEIPLLTSKKDYPYLNRVLLVTAEPQLRLQRVIARDQCSAEHANAIIEVQASEEAYRNIADDVLINHGSFEDLEVQVLALHQDYLHRSFAT